MRFDKTWISLKEFAAEAGYHPNTVKLYILKKGKCRYEKNGPDGHYRIRREWADEYHSKNTFGGTAYGKKAA